MMLTAPAPARTLPADRPRAPSAVRLDRVRPALDRRLEEIRARQIQIVTGRNATIARLQLTLKARQHAALAVRESRADDRRRDADLRRRLTTFDGVINGLSAAGQVALREVLSQSVGQGVTILVRSALIAASSRSLAALYATQLSAGVAVAAGALYAGHRTANLLWPERTPQGTLCARNVVAVLPLAAQLSTLLAAGSTDEMVKRMSGMTARVPGSMASALCSQAQSGAWGTVRIILEEPDPASGSQARENPTDLLRFTLTSGVYAVASMLLLVLMTDWLAQRIGGDKDSHAFGELCRTALAGALAKVALAIVFAGSDVLAQTAAAVRHRLPVAYVPGHCRKALRNLHGEARTATLARACNQFSLRVSLSALVSDVPSLWASDDGANTPQRLCARLATACANFPMALRGFVLRRAEAAHADAAQRQENRLLGLEADAQVGSGVHELILEGDMLQSANDANDITEADFEARGEHRVPRCGSVDHKHGQHLHFANYV